MRYTLPSFFSWFLEASIALTFRSLVHTLLLRSTVMSPSPDIASCFRVCTSTGSASKASLILLILPRNRDSDTGGLEKSQSTWHQCQERNPRITNTTKSEIYSCPVVRNNQIVTVRTKIIAEVTAHWMTISLKLPTSPRYEQAGHFQVSYNSLLRSIFSITINVKNWLNRLSHQDMDGLSKISQ